MTEVYFVRHAESDISVRDGRTRPLTAKGMADRRLVTDFLSDKEIDAVLSSPYKRAVDTVSEFAEKHGYEVEFIEDFRERGSDSDWDRVNDYFSFIRRQWSDFSYKLSDGESLDEVQRRNIAALNEALARYKDKTIVIGTHGTALSTIINYYDESYGYDDFMAMVNIMPWVVKMYFGEAYGGGADGNDRSGAACGEAYGGGADGSDRSDAGAMACAGMQKIDLFDAGRNTDTGPKTDAGRMTVRTADLGALKAYRFVVVFARHKGKWLYCRTKGTDVYETAGGHIEPGETPLEAAGRELYEETGAVAFDIEPAFDYSVRLPTVYSYGQVFFASIRELGEIPEYETAVESTALFDAAPENMRFPDILPVLYDRMLMWLNLRRTI